MAVAIARVHTAPVRLLVLVLVSVGVLAATASAATVDPKLLVLGQADVPAGFRLDRESLLTNAKEAAREPRLGALYKRSGRITGYESAFETVDGGSGPSIESRADLFRQRAGARTYFSAFDHEMKLAGIAHLARTRAKIGSQGLVFNGTAVDSDYTLVFWRHGRAVGAVLGLDIGQARTLRLARLQERRIAAAAD